MYMKHLAEGLGFFFVNCLLDDRSPRTRITSTFLAVCSLELMTDTAISLNSDRDDQTRNFSLYYKDHVSAWDDKSSYYLFFFFLKRKPVFLELQMKCHLPSNSSILLFINYENQTISSLTITVIF